MSQISPVKVFSDLAAAIPRESRWNLVMTGSVAAGYHFFCEEEAATVQTQGVDLVLTPHAAAVSAGERVARALLRAGWRPRAPAGPQATDDPDLFPELLPKARFYPPGVDPASPEAWYVQLLAVPGTVEQDGAVAKRLSVPQGHFALASFPYLPIATFSPMLEMRHGLRYARPEMITLAHLLEHPKIRPERLTRPVEGRTIKRSNKDLGSALAITLLAALDDYRPWASSWQEALIFAWPDTWRQHVPRVGAGLRALLASEDDLEEARHSCATGLLASRPGDEPPVKRDALRAAGERLLGDAIALLEDMARRRGREGVRGAEPQRERERERERDRDRERDTRRARESAVPSGLVTILAEPKLTGMGLTRVLRHAFDWLEDSGGRTGEAASVIAALLSRADLRAAAQSRAQKQAFDWLENFAGAKEAAPVIAALLRRTDLRAGERVRVMKRAFDWLERFGGEENGGEEDAGDVVMEALRGRDDLRKGERERMRGWGTVGK